jgi:hypothetical protein
MRWRKPSHYGLGLNKRTIYDYGILFPVKEIKKKGRREFPPALFTGPNPI